MEEKLKKVKEVCEMLQIKEPRAYQLAALWEKTNGREGLPCIRLGPRQLRFSLEAIRNHFDRQNNEQEELA